MMDREAAVALCREKCMKETTVRHLISVEGVMRGLARRFGQDEDLWGLTGMFHDSTRTTRATMRPTTPGSPPSGSARQTSTNA